MSQGMLGVSVREVGGVVTDLLEKLGGPNGGEWLAALKRFLRKESPWDDAITFPVWRTITLGGYKSVEDVRKVFERQKVHVSDWASDLMDQPAFTLASEKTDLNLVKVSVAELGFLKDATRREIYDHAKKLGLELCPAEVGPALRYQYPDQPQGEWLAIAMESVTGSDGHPFVFRVARDDSGRWLDTYWGSLGFFWGGEDQFVFCK